MAAKNIAFVNNSLNNKLIFMIVVSMTKYENVHKGASMYVEFENSGKQVVKPRFPAKNYNSKWPPKISRTLITL